MESMEYRDNFIGDIVIHCVDMHLTWFHFLNSFNDVKDL